MNGHPLLCDNKLEIAALISSMNPTMNATTDCVEMGLLQKQLLWLIYEMGYLQKYPMALGKT